MSSMFAGALTDKIRRFGIADGEPKAESQLDMAWAVLDAANDFGDQATIEVCRRFIDASLDQMPALASDIHIISNYFR